MKAYFAGDQALIDHAMRVLSYAEDILADDPNVSGPVVRAAAILHDIGIPQARLKHGSSAGKWQELEGPPVARQILTEMNINQAVIDHVCKIIANHHSDGDIDTPEFRIIWDADWLVNIPCNYDMDDPAAMKKMIYRVFKTNRGKQLAESLFLERNNT